MSGTDKARNTKQDVKGKAKEAAGKLGVIPANALMPHTR